ncbi:MAG: copper-translocating P-type ATPase [Patescibacteria group bacterium]|nr:copper-translocating P-type ATPase [Patescibacteria group bacterium]
MNTEIFKVEGMHCASCASIIERTVSKLDGVESISVNAGTENAKISFKDKINIQDLNLKLEPLGYSLVTEINDSTTALDDTLESSAKLSQSKKAKLAELTNMKTKVISAIPLAVISIFIMAWDLLGQYHVVPVMSQMVEEFFHHLLPLMATYTLFVVGKPYLLGLYRFIRHGKANMDTLVGIGTTSAFLYSFAVTAFANVLQPFVDVNHTYYDVTIVVITFIALGKYLETRSKAKTGDAIEKLLNLQAKTALVIRNGKEIELSINDVKHNDEIIVKPGAKIPVDGIISKGSSFIDESMITGEPIPNNKNIGDTVIAGTINTSGSFVFKATKIGSETLLAQIIKMVKDAQESKAPIQTLADNISSIFVPIVLVIAFVTLTLWILLATGPMGFSQAMSFGLVSFVGVLVIACPCALGLATPTAIIVGVGKGAKEGILVKDAATLEKLYKVDTVVFDKTGTITLGKPRLVDIKNFSNLKDDKLVSILASLESKSEHPIGQAIINYAKEKNISIVDTSDFENIEGMGLKSMIEGVFYYAGNVKLIKDLNLNFDSSAIEPLTNQGKTPVILATKEKVFGFVMVADEIKKESKQAIIDLHKLGLKVVMLTGDDKRAAKYIASLIGIDEVVANVLPQNKLDKIKELQSQGKIVAMAGDGVNDAPALAQADVGIAMSTGTDVAIESSGITLLDGDISKIVKAIKLSKITMRGIKQNLFWAFVYNIIGIPLATGMFYPIFGWLLNPIFAGMAMALSSISVVSNSLRIKSMEL